MVRRIKAKLVLRLRAEGFSARQDDPGARDAWSTPGRTAEPTGYVRGADYYAGGTR